MQPSGPYNAKVMIVGEAPSEFEILRGEPFVGPSGQELNRMLSEAGILRNECFLTNVCLERPPDNDIGQWLAFLVHAPKPDNKKYRNQNWVRWRDAWVHPSVVEGYRQLIEHIKAVKPTLVIALGNAALYALTGKKGIKAWRGSMLMAEVGGHRFKVIPTYHPSAVLRDWSTRAVTVHDLGRAARERLTADYTIPHYDRIIRPTFGEACNWLAQVRIKLMKGEVIASVDIETRAGHIACTGFYIRGLPTLCIPWMCVERPEGYWSAAEELYLTQAVTEIMLHPSFKVVGQNWTYDAQYKWRYFFIKKLAAWDTMTAHHCMFPGTPKGLDYLASLHCKHYVYWKDDGKLWDPRYVDEDSLWTYNCEDCERTYEVYESQRAAIEADPRLKSVWDFQTNRLTPLLFKAMTRGIRADTKNKARLSKELEGELAARETWLTATLGHALNHNSPTQMKQLFYGDFGLKPIINRKARERTVTTNEEALLELARREPVLKGLINKLLEMRAISKFKGTYVDMRLDKDQRIRCSFNIAGTTTFRLSSDENAFGSGTNLQNIPTGTEDADDPDTLELPNIRKFFLPDEGQVLWDADLRNADFYTVVWETDDEQWRLALESGVDMHLLNVGTLMGIKELNLESLRDPEFVEWGKKKYGKQRKFAKAWCHGTDFGGKDRTMAATCGITVRENERFRLKWFGEHPGLKAWHERTELQLQTKRYVENRFGYRYYFFDRVEGALPEALAWVPQSTTGCVINRAWEQVDKLIPETEVLLQVHDSLVGQFPSHLQEEMLRRIPEAMKITVPYERPMVIPVGLKTSNQSWGHC